jgi:multiple sugar transport system substrate-binding protein
MTFAPRGGLAATVLAALCFALAACGGGDDGGDTAATPGTEETGATEGAPTAPALQEAEGASGEVTYCTGKDTSGAQTDSVEKFNEEFGGQITAKLLEFPESADEQRNQFIQRQRAGSGECDIFYADVIWTAEFAQQKWLMDMTEYVESRKDEFIESTLGTIQYDGKYWGVPKQTDAGFMYYRTDQVDEFPATYQELYRVAEENDGLIYQGAAYEGLTCVFTEMSLAAGGRVLSEDGKESQINSPENVRALQLMVDGIESGAVPRAVVTYMEENARRSFEQGRATFMRNWPYAFALGQKADRIKGKFAVAPHPQFEGGGTGGVLGGHNLVISASAKNPEGAVKLIDFLTREEAIKRDAAEYSLAPVLKATYDDPEVQEALPFASELKTAVENAGSRPVSPVYPQISQAIYDNVNAALSGQASPEEALQRADEQINRALATF